MRILGLDPGLRHTGWGLIEKEGSKVTFVAAGVISAQTDLTLAERLAEIHTAITQVILDFHPDEAAIE